MSKFLLTVCAFGLLLSFAFAEEKSPEQYREESNQIFGQKMELTRVVASGTNQRIYFFYVVHPDCSSGDINIRVTKQPGHGTVETAAATNFPNSKGETSATGAISVRFAECRFLTSRPRNTSATIHSTYSFSSPADSLGKFIST